MKDNPIGIFDSGIGGLTCVKEIFRILPNEKIIYFGDTARVPYGTKTKKTIIKFADEITKFLLKKKVKLIVVACNTVSSNALNFLNKNFKIPIIGCIEPGVKSACKVTKNGKIGVIGTSATIESNAYPKLIKKIDKNIEVYQKSCPLFVPLVEEGFFDGEITELIAKKYLISLRDKGIDTLILGCTHYPLLKGVISKVMGEKVKIIDSASSLAVSTKNILKAKGLLRTKRSLDHEFYLSDIPRKANEFAKNFLGKEVKFIFIENLALA